MKLEFLTGEQHCLYAEALALYCGAFPREERRETEQWIPSHPDFCPGLLTQDERLLGILFYWEGTEFVYLEHFAVVPQRRNQGLGAQALALLKGIGKPVVLEIELPQDELTRRRKVFYGRNGFRENAHPHIQPKYRLADADLPLQLLSWPEAISHAQWQDFESYLQAYVAAPNG